MSNKIIALYLNSVILPFQWATLNQTVALPGSLCMTYVTLRSQTFLPTSSSPLISVLVLLPPIHNNFQFLTGSRVEFKLLSQLLNFELFKGRGLFLTHVSVLKSLFGTVNDTTVIQQTIQRNRQMIQGLGNGRKGQAGDWRDSQGFKAGLGMDSRGSWWEETHGDRDPFRRNPTVDWERNSCSSGKHTWVGWSRLKIQSQIWGPRAGLQAPQQEERKAGPCPQKGDVTNKEWYQSMGHIGRRGGAITQGRGSVMEKQGKNLVPELRPAFPCHVYR